MAKRRLDEFVEDMLVGAEAADLVDAEGRAAVEAGVDDEPSGPEAVAIEYVANYLALKAQIADLEVRAAVERQAAIEALDAERTAPGKTWVFEGLGTVAVVKGRVTEKLDRARLARAGVALAVLDAATVKTEGAPSVRISPMDPRGKAAMAAKGWQHAD